MFNTHIHIANVMWSRQNITHCIVSHLVLPAAGGRCLFVFFLKPLGTARGMPVRPGDSGQVGRSHQPALAFGYAKIRTPVQFFYWRHLQSYELQWGSPELWGAITRTVYIQFTSNLGCRLSAWWLTVQGVAEQHCHSNKNHEFQILL